MQERKVAMSKNSDQLMSKLQATMPRTRKPARGENGAIPMNGASRAPKLSVSLYQRDLQRLDEIKAFMQQNGVRNLSDSETLRLACRGVDIGKHLIGLYQEMQAEDGRRKAI
jgi:hypothetical protein